MRETTWPGWVTDEVFEDPGTPTAVQFSVPKASWPCEASMEVQTDVTIMLC